MKATDLMIGFKYDDKKRAVKKAFEEALKGK